MTKDVILVGGLGEDELKAFESQLSMMDFVLHVARDTAQMMNLIAAKTPIAILFDCHTLQDTLPDMCSTIKAAGYQQPLIALNRDSHSGRGFALQAGLDVVLDYPLNWHDLSFWIQTPRSQQGGLMSMGMMLGDTREDILGAASLLAHDMKSPISIVITTLQTVLALQEDQNIEDLNTRLLRGALQSSNRQMELMDNLFDVARLELGSYELEWSRVDLVQLVGECLEQEQSLLDTKQLKVELNLASGGLWVNVDIGLINRVFSAMLDNVLKFTIRDDQLTIDVCEENQHIIIRFTDSGRPITPGFEKDILHRAPQWDGRQAGSRTSVAMGLPFICAVATAHQGTFTADTHPVTKLTSFTFALPLAPAQAGNSTE